MTTTLREEEKAPPGAARWGHVQRAASLLTAVTVVGKALVFGQEVAAASAFGASRDVDALLVARLLPGLLTGAIGTVVSFGIIPIVVDEITRGRAGNHSVAGVRLLRLGGAAFFLLAVTLALGGPALMRFLAPGMPTAALEAGARFALLVAPLAAADAFILYLVAILQARRSFAPGAIAGLFNGLMTILAIVCLGEQIGVLAYIVGWAIGDLAQILLLLVFTNRQSVTAPAPAMTTDPRRVGPYFALPYLAIHFVANIVTFVDRGLASGVGPGAVAIINWVQKLYNLPLGLLVLPAITASFPTIASIAAEDDKAGMNKRSAEGLTLTAWILVPIALGMAVLAEPIVTLVFQRGAFTTNDARAAGAVLQAYSASIVFATVVLAMSRIAYAVRQPWCVARATAAGAITYILTAPLGVNLVGLPGVGWAYCLTMAITAAWLLVELRRFGVDEGGVPVLSREAIPTLLSAACMVLVMLLIGKAARAGATGKLEMFVEATVEALAGAAVYFGTRRLIAASARLSRTTYGK